MERKKWFQETPTEAAAGVMGIQRLGFGVHSFRSRFSGHALGFKVM